VDCVKALGFSSGVFHVECKLTSTGPQLVEVNARMGGGPVRECNLRVWGVDLVEEMLFCSLGMSARPVVPEQPLTSIGYAFFNAPRSGKLMSTQCLEDVKKRADVVSCDVFVSASSAVTGAADGLPTWLALLVVSKPTSKAALEYVQQIEAGLPLDIQ